MTEKQPKTRISGTFFWPEANLSNLAQITKKDLLGFVGPKADFEGTVGRLGPPEEETRYIIFQLIKIVRQLHQIDMIHGDIKPENIMYNDHTQKVTLIDFEYGKYTLDYAPPEYSGKIIKTKAVDIWGIGYTMYTMLMGHTPFNDREHLMSNIPGHPISPMISPDGKDFILSTVIWEPNCRLSINECYHHPLFFSYVINYTMEIENNNDSVEEREAPGVN